MITKLALLAGLTCLAGTAAALAAAVSTNALVDASAVAAQPDGDSPVGHWVWPTGPKVDQQLGEHAVDQDYDAYGQYVSGKYHTGYDIAVGYRTPVGAASKGSIILFVRNDVACDHAMDGSCADHGDGNTLVIRHGEKLYSQYQHLDALYAAIETEITHNAGCSTSDGGEIYHCRNGAVRVTAGQQIAYSGNTAYGLTGSQTGNNIQPLGYHLHFELHKFSDFKSPRVNEWGYTFEFPDSLGFIDPADYLNAAVRIPERNVTVNSQGAGAEMRLGPTANYAPIRTTGSAGTTYIARKKTSGTPKCLSGWYELTPTEAYPPTPANQWFGGYPDLWSCADFLSP